MEEEEWFETTAYIGSFGVDFVRLAAITTKFQSHEVFNSFLREEWPV